MQIVHIKTGDIYGDIAKGVEKRLGTLIMHQKSRYHKGKTKTVVVLMKGELGGIIMKECVGLTAKTYSYQQMTKMKVKR